MGIRGLLAALLLVVACGDESGNPLDPQAGGGKGEGANKTAEAIGDGGAGGSVVAARAVDIPIEQPAFDIDKVDAWRFVIGADVLTQVAAEIAANKITAKRVATGYQLSKLGDSAVLGKLGLADSDVIVSINGKPLVPKGLETIHATVRVNGYAKVSLIRGGEAIKRRYHLRSALERDSDSKYSKYLRKGPRIKAKLEFEALIKEMRGGVQLGAQATKVDRAVLEVIGESYDLLRYGQTYSYGSKTRGIHVSDRESVYGVLGLSPYDVVKAVGTTDTFYRRKFQEAIGAHASMPRFGLSVVRLGEPTVLQYEVVTGLITDVARLKSLAETWRRKAKESDPYGSRYGSLTGSGSSGAGLGGLGASGSGSTRGSLTTAPYVRWSVVRPLVAAVEGTRRGRGDYKLSFKAKAVRDLIGEPGALEKGVRAIPAFGGDGLRLYGLISGSPMKVLGFKSLDTVHSVNGATLRKRGDLSVLKKALKTKRKIRVKLTRRYKKQTLELTLR